MRMSFAGFCKSVGAALLAAVMAPRFARAETVKIGVLHSLSGTMAISETSLRDVVLMAVEEINAKGGVHRASKIEPVVVDPASNWPLFAEKAKQLIVQDKVAVTFGCWTSVSRKSVPAGLRSQVHARPRTPTAAACCSTPCSTRAKSRAPTSSTPAPAPTSSSSPPPNT